MPTAIFRSRRRPSKTGGLHGVSLQASGGFSVGGIHYQEADGCTGLPVANGMTVSKIPGANKPLLFCDANGSVRASRVFTRNQWRTSNGYAAVRKQPRELPKQSWWEWVMGRLSGKSIWWLDFQEVLPGLCDLAQFKSNGTIDIIPVGGSRQTVQLGNPQASVELEANGLPTGWSLSVDGKRKATLRHDKQRLALKFDPPDGWHQLVVLQRAEVKKDFGGFMLLRGGQVIFTEAKPRPFVACVKQSWNVNISCAERMESLGNNWLVHTDAAGRQNCYYFLNRKWHSVTIPNVSYYAPIVLQSSEQLQTTVAGGAIQLFADGTMSVLGQFFYMNEDVDVVGPGGLWVHRDVSETDWVYAVDDQGVEQAGVFKADGYWCWGGTTQSPQVESSRLKWIGFIAILFLGWCFNVELLVVIATVVFSIGISVLAVWLILFVIGFVWGFFEELFT